MNSGKNQYKIWFTTETKNPGDPAGKWCIAYTGDTKEEAEERFLSDMEKAKITVIEYQIE